MEGIYGPSSGQSFGINAFNISKFNEKAGCLEQDSPIPMRKPQRAQTNTGFEEGDFNKVIEQKKHESNSYFKGKQVQTPVPLSHFKMYGSGIYLFFSFLFEISILFLVLSILSIVPITINYVKGSAFQNSQSSLQYFVTKSSIGNFSYSDSNLTYNQSIHYKIANVVIDILTCVLFLSFFFYWEIKSDKIVEQINTTVRLLSSNTLEISGFSPKVKENTILNFMSRFGNVLEVAAVKNYSDMIEKSKTLYEKKLQIKQLQMSRVIEQDNQNQNETKIKKLEQEVNRLQKEWSENNELSSEEILKFYVQFENPAQRNQILKKFQVYQKTIKCCGSQPPQQMLLEGQLIEVKQCKTQPTGIIWQNVHITWSTRWLRSLLQFFIILAVIVGGFLFISFLNILLPPSSASVDTASYNWTTIQNEQDKNIVQSWCIKQLSFSAKEYQSVCYSYWKSYIFGILIKIGIAVAIIVLKAIIKIIMVTIAKFQRYVTHTEQSVAIMTNLLITYISTTVLITFLMQANVFQISFKSFIRKLVTSPDLINNLSLMPEYYDLTSNWYKDIGYQIWFNVFILSFVPHVFMPLVFLAMECLNQFMAKGEKMYKKMYDKVRPPQFEIEENYANILMIVLIGFIFGGGSPCMIIVSFIGLATRFLYYRYIFIRFCRVPKTYNQALNDRALSIMKIVLFIRCLLSLYMYGANNVFAMEKSAFMKWTETLEIPVFSSLFVVISRVFLTWYYSMFVVLFGLALFFKELLINNLIKLCRSGKEGNSKLEESAGQFNNNDTSSPNNPTTNNNNPNPPSKDDEENKDQLLSQRCLTKSYKLQNNPDYIEILAIMKMKCRKSIRARQSISPTFIHNT